MKSTDPFFDGHRHLAHLQDYVLLDIARNESAQMDYRLFAVELLQARKSEKLKHPDIQHLVKELEIELDGIVFEHPAPSEPGPMTSGVTTQTLYGTGEEVIDNSDPISPDSVSTTEADVSTTEPTPVPTEPKPKELDAAQS
jgi:hypothetical protein